MTADHTCTVAGRVNCVPCMQLEGKLWDAINRYAIAVGGDPAMHVYGNTLRMQAVAAVGAVISKLVAPLRVDAIAIDELVRGNNAAAARACSLQEALAVVQALPTNPYCTGTVGRDFVTCGEEGYSGVPRGVSQDRQQDSPRLPKRVCEGHQRDHRRNE